MENKHLSEQLKEILIDLSDEQKEKAKTCKSVKELLDFFGAESIGLPDEALDAVAGGGLTIGESKFKYGMKCSCRKVWTEQELANNNYNCPNCGAFLFPDPAEMSMYKVSVG